MEPWYKLVTPRKEVRAGRSFNPDEFAIALEQIVAGTAPEDYQKPEPFFSRTCFTRALREHAGMVLRRLSGETEGTAPVVTLITQFGGGKTHTLAALYHLVTSGTRAAGFTDVQALLDEARLTTVPEARVGIFVGNAWDPQKGRETPWIDLARQLAGKKGVAALGPQARTTPPGTDALARVFAAAGRPVLVLFDEVLNFVNRHRDLAEPFHAFIQNLTVAMTGTTKGAAMISLPRSQVEMTDWDLQWQERITKVVRRVAKDLIANDETEISEVVRRRLFEDLGSERVRRNVCRKYADWCYERRAQLPPEWTAVDTATTEKKARELLRSRFEICYPFHPATLSVFQRKWQALPQYQQTRGTLAMLAQWVSWVYREGYTSARREALITLGSAPLEVPGFRGAVLGQLGESRLIAALDADIAGSQAHARALDMDTSGPLRDIHRRVGTCILFESSGGQTDKVAHLPELRFALGEPNVDTTSVDTAATALERRAFFIRKVGTDGFQVRHLPTLKKVVNDRRASLDAQAEVLPALRGLIQKEFEAGASLTLVPFPENGAEIEDTPRLKLVLGSPDLAWTGGSDVRSTIAAWTRRRGTSDRLYPAALVWCVRKPGRELRERIELLLAWRRVEKDVRGGVLGSEFDASDRADIREHVKDAEDAARDEVWAAYRYVVLADRDGSDGLKVIDLGAGHASSGGSLCDRVVRALKSEGLLNEGVGAGYLERHWPPALREEGAWPLPGLRQCFLDGSLTRLLDPDDTLKRCIARLVKQGDLGLASGAKADRSFERVWFNEEVGSAEIAFESGVFLLKKKTAAALKAGVPPEATTTSVRSAVGAPVIPPAEGSGGDDPAPLSGAVPSPVAASRTLRLSGAVPPEIWNRLGTKVIPKLRSGTNVHTGIDLAATFDAQAATSIEADLRRVLDDLGLTGSVSIE